MSRYIDAEKIPFVTGDTPNEPLDYVRRYVIDNMSAADVEDVCRCEHCSKSGEHPNGRWCIIHQTVVQNSDYCSWGTKR